MVVVVVVLCVRLEGVDESAEADEDRVHDHHHQDGVAGHREGEVVQVCVNVLVMQLVIRFTGHAGFLGRVVRVLGVVVVAVEALVFAKASDATDEETRDYFAANEYLGLNREDVVIFKQGTMPAVDASTGKLLLAERDRLALSPDGHGGTVTALERHGCLRDAASRGVKYLAYIQVDNPLANLCDPTLLGHHILSESEMTTQVVRKRYATEKVGNVVLVDGQVEIIEYSDLADEAAEAVDGEGALKLWAGNIAVQVFDLDFLRRMSGESAGLLFHRASKKVPYVNEEGDLIQPEAPNATKFERFIFDLLPAARNAFVVEALPRDAFAPVKNADGAEADTPALARQAISDLHRGWLKQADAWVGEGVQVEINPRFALSADELQKKIVPNSRIESDRYFDA